VININLIAERRARRQREVTILRMSTLGVVLIVFIMVVLNLAWWKLTVDTAHTLTMTEQTLTERRVERDAFRALKADVEEKREIVTLLGQVRVSESAWMIILADISRVISPDVVLASFTTETKNDAIWLRLTGRARDFKTAGSFMESLRVGTRWAKTPTLGGLTSGENRDTGVTQATFEIRVPVEGLYGGEF